jgi:signal transduction histidine kinase
MRFDTIVNFFLPGWIRHHKTHPDYNELRIVVSTALVGLPLMLLFPPLVYYLGKPIGGFLLNDALIIIILLSCKFFGHYRIPMSITALVTYFIIYDWIENSGLIYSVNNIILHMYLLAAIWADKKYGWWAIFTNLLIFGFIYHQTLQSRSVLAVHTNLGEPLYPLVMNCLITIFFGVFVAYQQFDQERDRAKIRSLQDQKITQLDDAVKKRTEQLNSMRETIATDFHDQTGNMLSAITRQASLLKMKLKGEHEVQPMVKSIIDNSNELYASSKDFLWHLNHNSDDPIELFAYLTGYGQRYYNQFDIAFSAINEACPRLQFDPSAALNLIFIFKEAMTNVVKHAGATEVKLTMDCSHDRVSYLLDDNGSWKEADDTREHYGLTHMERRCQKNNFEFTLVKHTSGTKIGITVPVRELNNV